VIEEAKISNIRHSSYLPGKSSPARISTMLCPRHDIVAHQAGCRVS